MAAREQLQKLTNGWYSMAVVSAGASLLMNGLGIFSIVGSVLSLSFMFLLTWWIGRKLQNRSSLTRSVCILASVVFSVLGILGIFGLGRELFEDFRLSIFVDIALMVMTISMNVRSFRVLTDTQVKQYFAAK
jgi:hypothetical protein